jgi:hypothetical protein
LGERRHFLDGLQKGFTRSRELRAMGDAMKQRRTDLGLQVLDLLTERGLPDADLGGGPGEVTFLRDRQKISDMASSPKAITNGIIIYWINEVPASTFPIRAGKEIIHDRSRPPPRA